MAQPSTEDLVVIGTLTDEGVECQALREDGTNDLYTFPRREAYRPGDQVKVTGTKADVGFCMQGTEVRVASIEKL